MMCDQSVKMENFDLSMNGSAALSLVHTLAEKQSCELSTGWLSLYDQYDGANEKCRASEEARAELGDEGKSGRK